MGNPYIAPTISGYNASPPPNDDTEVAANAVDWDFTKVKIGDPLKTLTESAITNTAAAFGKILFNGVSNHGVNYTVQGADQGKMIRATAAITITAPVAATVAAPFAFIVRNDHTATITIDGNGSETIDGAASLSLQPGRAVLIGTDGTNWFTGSFTGVTIENDQGRTFTAFDDTGAANAYVITPAPAIAAYAKYQSWVVDIANANTGASTMNISGLGVRNIFDFRTGAALIGQEMRAGLHTFVDDGTQLILMNPVSKLSVNFFAFDETTDVSFTSNVPTGTVFSSSQDILIPTKGLLRFSFHGRIINNSGATLPFHIGIRVNGVDYWPHVDLDGVITYHQHFTLAASNYRELRGSILVTQGQQGVDNTLDIEGQGIATGLQTVQPVIAAGSGATSHTIQGVTTTARFKLAVEDYS